MAIKVIDIGSGQTYATLSAAESGERAGVTADDYVFTIHNDITDEVDFGDVAWATPTSITVTSESGTEHDGTPGTGVRITSSLTYSAVIGASTRDITIEKLEIYGTGTGMYGIYSASASPGNITLHRCIISAVNSCIHNTGNNSTITSNLFIDSGTGFHTVEGYIGITLANNTALDCTTGFHVRANVTCLGDNNVAYGGTTRYDNSGTWTGDYNAADDAATNTPPGTNSITTNIVSGDFNAVASDDVSLSGTGSTLYHAGDVVSGVTTDIAGNTFDASTPSVGAFELVSGGTIIPQASRHSNIILG